MRPVNLMQREQSVRSVRPSALLAAAAVTPVLAIGIVAGAYTYEHHGVSKAQGQLSTVQSEIAALPTARTQSAPQLAALATERNARLSSLDSALSDRFELYPALVAIARVIPADVWLTSLNLSSPTPADQPPPAPATPSSSTTSTTTTTATTTTPAPPPVNVNAFTISGYTYSQDSVARLLTQLSLLPMLSDVTLTSSSTQSGSSSPGDEGGTTTNPTGTNKKSQPALVQFAVSAAVNPSPSEVGT